MSRLVHSVLPGLKCTQLFFWILWRMWLPRHCCGVAEYLVWLSSVRDTLGLWVPTLISYQRPVIISLDFMWGYAYLVGFLVDTELPYVV